MRGWGDHEKNREMRGSGDEEMGHSWVE